MQQNSNISVVSCRALRPRTRSGSNTGEDLFGIYGEI